MQTSIPYKHLAAVLIFSGKQDVRYYLNGVFVEVSLTEVRVSATDGNTAAVARHTESNTVRFDVIVPRATVELALKMRSEVISLVCEDTGNWSLAGIRFTPVDGKFPDYRRIIPNGYSGEAAQFDPEFITRASKAGRALGHKGLPIIRHNGKDAALVQFYGNDNFIGVIMAYNHFTTKYPDQGLPTWGAERN
jgi:DNA polymerase-3 subunit beta